MLVNISQKFIFGLLIEMIELSASNLVINSYLITRRSFENTCAL